MLPVFLAKWPFLALCAALGTAAWVAFPFTVDDAYITARYADRLAAGLGYTFNDGAATDGVTGPLWLLPLALSAWAGLEPLGVAKILGLVCVGIACWAGLLRARSRARGATVVWATAGLCATSLSLPVWGVAGLETGAATLAFTGMALATTARAGPRPFQLGVAIACSAWLRPEFCFAALACLVCAALRDRRAACRALWLGLGGAVALVVFRWLMFGDWLPLSAFAKPPQLGPGLRYLLGALLAPDVACGSLLGAWVVRQGGWQERQHAAITAAHALGCVLSGGDWMPGRRLFAPLAPLAALTLAVGIRTLAASRPAAARGSLAILLLLGLVSLVLEVPKVREAGLNRQRQVPRVAAILAERPVGSVMALDIGALGALSGRRILDLGGLVEPHVAHAPGGHLAKRIDESWVVRNAPTWLVLHSAIQPRVGADGGLLVLAGYPVERRVARMRFVRDHYRVRAVQRYADGYFYVILAFASPAVASDLRR